MVIDYLVNIFAITLCILGIYLTYGNLNTGYGPVLFVLGFLLFRRKKNEK